ncbi:MAG TPA: FKBP-type peptidyl-prolyl cis-trans isomerase [Nitrospiraceae bacterium]
MRRHSLTKAGFIIVILSCTVLLGEYGIGAKTLPQTNSLRSQAGEPSQIVEGSKVTLQYVARVPGSDGIDYGNISEFIQGRHEIFPALEREVIGMKAGEEKSVQLSPEEGFGPHDDGKKLNVPKTILPFGAREGDILRNDIGELATVAEVSDTTAVLDYNHPLAGKPLVVQVKILKVENP